MPGDEGSGRNIPLFAAAPIPAVLLADGRIVDANAAFTVLVGRGIGDLRGVALAELAHREDRDRLDVVLAESRGRTELRLVASSGATVDVEVHAAAVDTELGDLHVQVVDRRPQRAREVELRAMALTDELTGLSNRRGFSVSAEQLLRVARRDGRDVTFLFVDVDGLKGINDRLGHAAGDDAIRMAARIMRGVFRDADALGRYGGDEFCVLALTRSVESARELRRRLDAAVADHAVAEEMPFRLELTVGVVHRPAAEVVSLESLIADADRAMYERRAADGATPSTSH